VYIDKSVQLQEANGFTLLMEEVLAANLKALGSNPTDDPSQIVVLLSKGLNMIDII